MQCMISSDKKGKVQATWEIIVVLYFIIQLYHGVVEHRRLFGILAITHRHTRHLSKSALLAVEVPDSFPCISTKVTCLLRQVNSKKKKTIMTEMNEGASVYKFDYKFIKFR